MPLTRTHTILAKIEATKGVDASPAAADAVQVIEPSVDGPNYEQIDTAYASSDLDSDPSEVGSGSISMTFQTSARGSGDATNTAPETDKLFLAAGMRRAEVGDLDVGMASGRLALGQEIEDAASAARAVVLWPQAASGLARVFRPADDPNDFGQGGALNILTGPSLAQTPVVAAGEYVGSKFGYQPTSVVRTQHAIGSYATQAPAVGEMVVYSDTTTSEKVGAGLVTAITDGTTQTVEVYWTKGGRGLQSGDTVARAADAAHKTTISSIVASEGASATLDSFLSTYKRKLLGGQSSWSFSGEAGSPGRFSWAFQGTPGNPIDGQPPTGIVYPTTNPPRLINTFCELNGIRFVMKSFAVDLGANLQDDADMNAPTGSLGSEITDRSPTMSLSIAYPGVAGALDLPQMLREAGTFPGGCAWGPTSGNQIAIVAPRLQVLSITDTDNNGKMGWELQLKCCRRSGGADDSILIDYR